MARLAGKQGMAIRSILLSLSIACTPYVPTAHGFERLGDAAYVYEYGRYADAAIVLERDYLALIESAPDEERFNLYRSYDRLMGTWLQVDFLQTLLDIAVDATSRAAEEEIRSTLRDHVRYVLWELDNAIAGLEQLNPPEPRRLTHLEVDEVCRSLLSSVRIAVNRLLVDHCATAACTVDP